MHATLNFVLDEKRILELQQLEELEHRSKTDLLKEAIDLLFMLRTSKPANNLESFFGAWSNKKIDGLAYQKKIRSEWE